MIDIANQRIRIDCPDCSKQVEVTLNQVSQSKLVRCRCGQQIQLLDEGGSSKNTIRNVNKELSKVEKIIKSLGS